MLSQASPVPSVCLIDTNWYTWCWLLSQSRSWLRQPSQPDVPELLLHQQGTKLYISSLTFPEYHFPSLNIASVSRLIPVFRKIIRHFCFFLPVMGHSHPLNYYLVYCPVAMVVHFIAKRKKEMNHFKIVRSLDDSLNALWALERSEVGFQAKKEDSGSEGVLNLLFRYKDSMIKSG